MQDIPLSEQPMGQFYVSDHGCYGLLVLRADWCAIYGEVVKRLW